MNATARFALPLLHAGQAQKELFHNEALILADALIQPCVEAAGVSVPPADPAPGQCWIVGGSPSGAWSGKAGALALWTSGGWRFAAPREGMSAWIADERMTVLYSGGGWQIGRLTGTRIEIEGEQVLGPREPAIAGPEGGGVIDIEARLAIEAILATLRTHGLIDPGRL